MPWQQMPVDPGKEGMQAHQKVLHDEIRNAQDARKPRKYSDPGRSYNILQRIGRKLQGK